MTSPVRPLLRPLAIGLDVVDLSDPRSAGKAADVRFVRRVFTPAEARRIADAPDADLALWIHWAAKEAVFKAETCAVGVPPVFDHSAFEFVAVDPMPDPVRPGTPEWSPALRGFVRRPAGVHPVQVSVTGAVLALAGPAGSDADTPIVGARVRAAPTADVARSLRLPDGLDAIRADTRFHPEVERAHSLPSAAVRLALRNDLRASLLDLGDTDASNVVVVTPEGPAGRTPPHVEGGAGPRDDVEISITHHGDLVAWTWRIDGPGRGPAR